MYIYSRILLNHKGECNTAFCWNVDGIEGNYVKWNKPDRVPHVLFHIWESKNKYQFEWMAMIITGCKVGGESENR
jgi:hypothetical protein